MPVPNTIGTQGTNRPGASSASSHFDNKPRSHPAAPATPSGKARPVGRCALSNAGAHALAPPRARPCGLYSRANAPYASRHQHCNQAHRIAILSCGQQRKGSAVNSSLRFWSHPNARDEPSRISRRASRYFATSFA